MVWSPSSFQKYGTEHNSVTHYLITVICNAVTLTPPFLRDTARNAKQKPCMQKAVGQKLVTVIRINFN